MADNWLATLGSWIVTPLKLVLSPWWDRLVEQKAESLAVQFRLLEAIVRFRLKDYQQKQSLDGDRASGIALKVVDRLKPHVRENPTIHLCGEEFLETIQREIELHAVPLTVWVELACAAEMGTEDPRKAVGVEFTDDKGAQSHGSTVILSLQSSFPFTKVWNMTDLAKGHLSGEAIALLTEYCSRNTLPETRYELRDSVSTLDWTLPNPSILPRAWKPNKRP